MLDRDGTTEPDVLRDHAGKVRPAAKMICCICYSSKIFSLIIRSSLPPTAVGLVLV